VLLAEFLVCMVIVGLGVTGVDPSEASSHAIRRVSALCALFFILATVSAWGDGPRRAANGLGGLVTLTFLVAERQGFTSLAAFFKAAQATGDKASGGVTGTGATETAPTPSGTTSLPIGDLG
jgi:hypothetical protein